MEAVFSVSMGCYHAVVLLFDGFLIKAERMI
jgi:hypothetical protein